MGATELLTVLLCMIKFGNVVSVNDENYVILELEKTYLFNTSDSKTLCNLVDGIPSSQNEDNDSRVNCKVEIFKKFSMEGNQINNEFLYLLQKDGSLYYDGIYHLEASYNESSGYWESKIFENGVGRLAARLKKDTFPIGSHTWQIYEDCAVGDCFFNLNLHLHVQQPGSFCCDTGECISSDKVCDGRTDCKDQVDENDCESVAGNQYNPDRLPVTLENKERPNILVYF